MSGCYICGDNDTVVVEVCNDCVIESESSPQHEMNRNMAEGKVRTMSGKPHTPRKLVKDKNITPKEAAKRMKLEAETFNALDMELDRNDCCELWVEKMYDNGRIGFGEASNLLASIEMDGLKCSSLGSSNCSKENMGAESQGLSKPARTAIGLTALGVGIALWKSEWINKLFEGK